MSEGDEPLRPGAMALVPRFANGGYTRSDIEARRAWLEAQCAVAMPLAGSFDFDSEAMRGNIESPIGVAQVPLGVAGPLLVHGEHAEGTFYVPFATTEGAIVRSYERGMVALTRSGGVTARVERDENFVAPLFVLPDLAAAAAFARAVEALEPELRIAAEATTRHGRLLGVATRLLGRRVLVELRYATGDAHGMNMIVRASEAACRLVEARLGVAPQMLASGFSSEKRPSGRLLAGGKGKRVVAGARVERRWVQAILHTTPEALASLMHASHVAHLEAGALGANAQAANALAALAIACGQDVANLANAAVAITQLEVTGEGDLYASVTLPSLVVATVGGGTGLGTGRECLALLGCAGPDKARKLAEIVAATVLAGEISMSAALASGEFAAAHETYGRNRPEAPSPSSSGSRG